MRNPDFYYERFSRERSDDLDANKLSDLLWYREFMEFDSQFSPFEWSYDQIKDYFQFFLVTYRIQEYRPDVGKRLSLQDYIYEKFKQNAWLRLTPVHLARQTNEKEAYKKPWPFFPAHLQDKVFHLGQPNKPFYLPLLKLTEPQKSLKLDLKPIDNKVEFQKEPQYNEIRNSKEKDLNRKRELKQFKDEAQHLSVLEIQKQNDAIQVQCQHIKGEAFYLSNALTDIQAPIGSRFNDLRGNLKKKPTYENVLFPDSKVMFKGNPHLSNELAITGVLISQDQFNNTYIWLTSRGENESNPLGIATTVSGACGDDKFDDSYFLEVKLKSAEQCKPVLKKIGLDTDEIEQIPNAHKIDQGQDGFFIILNHLGYDRIQEIRPKLEKVLTAKDFIYDENINAEGKLIPDPGFTFMRQLREETGLRIEDRKSVQVHALLYQGYECQPLLAASAFFNAMGHVNLFRQFRQLYTTEGIPHELIVKPVIDQNRLFPFKLDAHGIEQLADLIVNCLWSPISLACLQIAIDVWLKDISSQLANQLSIALDKKEKNDYQENTQIIESWFRAEDLPASPDQIADYTKVILHHYDNEVRDYRPEIGTRLCLQDYIYEKFKQNAWENMSPGHLAIQTDEQQACFELWNHFTPKPSPRINEKAFLLNLNDEQKFYLPLLKLTEPSQTIDVKLKRSNLPKAPNLKNINHYYDPKHKEIREYRNKDLKNKKDFKTERKHIGVVEVRTIKDGIDIDYQYVEGKEFYLTNALTDIRLGVNNRTNDLRGNYKKPPAYFNELFPPKNILFKRNDKLLLSNELAITGLVISQDQFDNTYIWLTSRGENESYPRGMCTTASGACGDDQFDDSFFFELKLKSEKRLQTVLQKAHLTPNEIYSIPIESMIDQHADGFFVTLNHLGYERIQEVQTELEKILDDNEQVIFYENKNTQGELNPDPRFTFMRQLREETGLRINPEDIHIHALLYQGYECQPLLVASVFFNAIGHFDLYKQFRHRYIIEGMFNPYEYTSKPTVEQIRLFPLRLDERAIEHLGDLIINCYWSPIALATLLIVLEVQLQDGFIFQKLKENMAVAMKKSKWAPIV